MSNRPHGEFGLGAGQRSVCQRRYNIAISTLPVNGDDRHFTFRSGRRDATRCLLSATLPHCRTSTGKAKRDVIGAQQKLRHMQPCTSLARICGTG